MKKYNETEKASIEQLLAFFGRESENTSQKTLVELEKHIDTLEEEEGEDRRRVDLNDFATALDTASHTIKFEAVYQTINYFTQFDIKDFTVAPVVISKLDAYKGQETLSDSDIEAISVWGNSLMEFSYGFESDKEIEEFEGYFGKQDDDYATTVLARGIGAAVLSLLPVKFQSPGGDDFIGYYGTGVTEAYIRFLGVEFISEKYNTKGKGPMSPHFSLAVITDLFTSFTDWLEAQK